MSSPSSLDELTNQQNLRLPLWDKASAEFYFAKSRELLSRPFPTPHIPHSSCRNLSSSTNDRRRYAMENQFQNLSFEDAYYRPRTQYLDRTLTKSESMTRKSYADSRYPKNYHENIPIYNGGSLFEASYVYYKTEVDKNLDDSYYERPRTLSFSETQEAYRKRNGRSIKDRNRRRQSYNPKAYESSSSESDCISIGSVDLDSRRRRRLSRLTKSNTSIRSESMRRSTNPFLKPGLSNAKMMGRSPPPSNSILSGLSPTSVARLQKSSHSTSSDSSL